ncbi:hypothetical protein LCGC14_2177990 [marine sediment metagenome]|uniref:Uncharacterized protein n=1 Tax=marine sediment metagenome TaxID=412755 RepID=A0A0F9GIY1_9ZZZZ
MRINGEWSPHFIEELTDWLGTSGRDFFQSIINKHGHLNVVLQTGSGLSEYRDGLPHPVHMREGMTIRNKMRDIHTAMEHPHEDAHWYDNFWMSAVKECLGIPTICEHCDDSGTKYVLEGGRYEKKPCPQCNTKEGAQDGQNGQNA